MFITRGQIFILHITNIQTCTVFLEDGRGNHPDIDISEVRKSFVSFVSFECRNHQVCGWTPPSYEVTSSPDGFCAPMKLSYIHHIPFLVGCSGHHFDNGHSDIASDAK